MKSPGDFKLKVAHKGLLIVAVVLVLQLLLVSSLSALLVASDKEHVSEAAHRDKAICAARLMFANVDSGVALVKTWRLRNMDFLEDLKESLARAHNLGAEIKRINLSLVEDQSYFKQDAQVAQEETESLLKKIGDISAGGLTFENLREVWYVQRDLNLNLRKTFISLQEYHRRTQAVMVANEYHLKVIMAINFALIALGMLMQTGASFFLASYFSRQFVFPIESLRVNVDRISHGFELTPPIPGNDEIADMDKSFRKMYAELALAAEREHALFDNASDVICILDDNMEVSRLNNAVLRMWGYATDQLLGSHISKVVCDSQWSSMKHSLDCSQSEEPAANFECDVVTESGQKLRCLWSTFWSEQNRSWFCVVHDISEQHRLEQLRESFLTMIARDLQQPLQRIYSHFESLSASTQFSEFAAAKISNSLGTLKRLTGLVGEILDFERLQSPEYQLDLDIQDIRATINSALRDVESLAANKGITVQVESAEILFSYDHAKMVRVLVNLLSNAIKYAPEGGTITITTLSTDNTLKVLVKDDGPGIESTAAAGLFKPFKQVSAGDGKRGGGTGLGLVISKKLVEMHHGQIGLDTQLGEGSTFWFTMPLQAAHASEVASPDASLEPAIAQTEKQSNSPAPVTAAVARRNIFDLAAPMENLGLKRVRLLLIGLPLTFEVIFIACLAAVLIQTNVERSKEIRERDLTLSAMNLCLGYCDAAICALDAGIKSMGGPSVAEPSRLNEVINSLPARAERLRRLANVDPTARPLVMDILKLTDRMQPAVASLGKKLSRSGMYDPYVLKGAHDQLLVVTSRVNQPVNALIEGCKLRQRLSPEKQRQLRTTQSLILGTGLLINILLAVAAANLFAHSIARRLKVMAENTTRLATNKDLLPPVSGTDEIAQLDESFHVMAARLREQRQKERAYLDNSRDVIGSFDQSMSLTSLNPAAEKLWGQSLEELSGRSVIALVYHEDRSSFEQLLMSLKNARPAVERVYDERDEYPPVDAGLQQQVGQFETRLEGSTDLSMLWSVSWSPKEQCYFFVAHDITRRKELERLKREFIAVVSHDLRSPLATIFGTTELMLHAVFGPITDDSRKVFVQVNLQVNQMLELINDLLDLEKLNAGQMQLTHSAVKVGDLLTRASMLCETVLEDRGHSAHITPSDMEVLVDEDRLAQALTYLILELSASLDDSAQIQMTASDGRAGGLRIAITSPNKKTAPEKMAAMQSKLENMHTPSNSIAEQSGSRLRLPLAKTIIEAHGGTVSVGTNITGAPVVYVWVPPSDAAPEEPNAPAEECEGVRISVASMQNHV